MIENLAYTILNSQRNSLFSKDTMNQEEIRIVKKL